VKFSSHPPTLPKIDELAHDTLVLAHFADERPLRGIGGLVDWRLNGKLSQLMVAEHITGQWGEQLMYPQGGRLPFEKVIYFGLGDRSKFGSTRFREVTHRIMRTLLRVGVSSFAMGLPGRDVLKLVPRQAIDIWLTEFQKVFVSARFNELSLDISLLESSDIHSEMDEQLDAFTRQYGPGSGDSRR
jgi:hypothetical protein